MKGSLTNYYSNLLKRFNYSYILKRTHDFNLINLTKLIKYSKKDHYNLEGAIQLFRENSSKKGQIQIYQYIWKITKIEILCR